MKSFKSITAIVMLLVCTIGFSQKVKINNDVASVDGTEYVKVSGGGMFSDAITISSLNGDELVYCKIMNPGKYSYFKIIFVGLDNKTAEISAVIGGKKDLIKKLYKDKVIFDGKLDPAKVDIFISKHEENISGYKTVNNGTQTIIIKEEPRKSGVNINIGN